MSAGGKNVNKMKGEKIKKSKGKIRKTKKNMVKCQMSLYRSDINFSVQLWPDIRTFPNKNVFWQQQGNYMSW